MQMSLLPLRYLYLSQGRWGGYSHAGQNACDFAKGTERCALRAPYDYKVVFTDKSWGLMVIQSTGMVLAPNGQEDYQWMALMHNENPMQDAGATGRQGEIFYHMGKADPWGNTTGIHVHIECGFGAAPSGWNYQYAAHANIEDCLYLTADTVVACGGGYGWKTAPKQGFIEEGGLTRYYNGGKMATGWQDIGGQRYYFRKSNKAGKKGEMMVGKRKIRGHYYFFSKKPATRGQRMTGWVKTGKTRYYFSKSAARQGRMLLGWQTIGGHRYYFSKRQAQLGKMLVGWQTLKGARYFFRKSASKLGRMATGTLKIGKTTYTFACDGKLIGKTG